MQVVDRHKVIEEVNNLIDEQGFKKAKEMWDFLISDSEINSSIDASNHLAVKYLHYTDHGLDHVTIVCRNVLQIIEIASENIVPAFIRSELGDLDDVAVICLAACYLHDVGHIIHRNSHELSSSIMAKELLYSKLKKLYPNANKRLQVLSHIQHAIIGHDESITCLTPEAGFVTLADGMDMTQGRSRKPYDLGKVDIHSISALSITNVEIQKGTKKKPIRLNIMMVSEAGVFQIEEVFLPKLRTSGLLDVIDIYTLVNDKPLALSQVLKMNKRFND
ncbi:MAG: HD domain-containing protein [Asgard group archaeon]|nr:HD domain-containing protein [Asgard group archaeon]